MPSIFGLFDSHKAKRKPPAIVATDTIVPVHFWDDTEYYRALVPCAALRFDDVLDADKLCNGLMRLLEIGDWRKLGGRLRMNATGKLELHIPERFTLERPACSFSHAKFAIKIDEHPLASKFPKAIDPDHPSIHASWDTFLPLMARPECPRCLDDYLYTDEPQLGLHVVSFVDATLVSVSWPHTTTDSLGLTAIFNAWTLVLQNKEDQVLPFANLKSDPLDTMGTTEPKEPYSLLKRRITGWHLYLFVARFLFRNWWYPKRETYFTICLPPKFVQGLKRQAYQSLQREGPHSAANPLAVSTTGINQPFLTDGDIVTAWSTCLAAARMPSRSSRTLAVLNIYELRRRLSNVFDVTRYSYVQNATLPAYTLMSARKVLQGSFFGERIGTIAALLRQTIIVQTTPSQIEAQARVYRTVKETTGYQPLFGDSTNFMIVMSNWTKGRLFDVDFSAAVIPSGGQSATEGKKRVNKIGRPSYAYSWVFNLRQLPNVGAGFNIVGQDAAGNYWICGGLRSFEHSKLKDIVERLR